MVIFILYISSNSIYSNIYIYWHLTPQNDHSILVNRVDSVFLIILCK